MKIVRMALVASVLFGAVSFAAGSAEARHHHRVCTWHHHHRHCWMR
ncbi:MAG TPA: hypothetical protein VGL66_19750 [Caulobacteraceae bacterium]|jgi:hypothetical protein